MMKGIILTITIVFFAFVSPFLLHEVKGGELVPAAVKQGKVSKDVPYELPRYTVRIVREGENLHLLAAYYYNNARLWRFIYKANKDIIKNPNLIYPGDRLLIPELPGND